MSQMPEGGEPVHCRRCGNTLDPTAALCTRCGTYVKSGLNAKTVARAGAAGRVGMALCLGGIAALLGGVIWAALARFLSVEVGYVAVGIGVAVGGAVAVTTKERGKTLALAAVGLALFGIIVGKLLTVWWAVPDIADEVMKQPHTMLLLLTNELIEKGDVDPGLKAYIELSEEEQNALPKEKQKAIEKKAEEFGARVAQRLSAMTTAEKRGLAKRGARAMLRHVGYWEQLKATLSPWDALWALLAIGSAWKMTYGTAEE